MQQSKPVISIAPMMGYSDRHFRYLMRIMSRHVRLYTEMVVTNTLIYGEKKRFLDFDPIEQPIALQLGGSDPDALKICAKTAENWGYDEVNLNVGCPSDRVQNASFGACLMAQPQLVADCIFAMNQAVSIPVTVKTRIGIDDQDSYELLHHFISTVAAAGCDTFIIHARKAWLHGLSPKENREIPPLRYEVVTQLKNDFSKLTFILNGGIKTIEQIQEQTKNFAGVMIGRAAYEDPYLIAMIDSKLTREEIMLQFFEYAERAVKQGARMHSVLRHALNLFRGLPGGRRWRQLISEQVPLVELKKML